MSAGPSVASVLVDFDGTACAHDVALHLLQEFGRGDWESFDNAVDAGSIGLREAITRQAALLDADDRTLLTYALSHCEMDPTFRPFADWCASLGVPVTLVSDGFGFYIAPLLRAHDIDGVDVITNTWSRSDDGAPGFAFGSGHPQCRGCGTCKMQAVVSARDAIGPVAFVGDGASDRYGALYADIVFAKDELAETCERDGVPFEPWTSFEEVRDRLEQGEPFPGPIAPVRCPGWMLA